MARRGFTLIEVVAAMAIGAASLAALLQVFGDGARQVDRAASERLAWLVAESALASAQASLAEGAAQGGETAGLAWQVEVSEAAEASSGGAAPRLLRVVATVWEAGAEGRPLARLASLRLAPGSERNTAPLGWPGARR
jgi:general secretion pathway protein I